ncbi:MAG: hypothetical protein MJD61_14075, partial [Proteobacteria bacterium]|nr:hypothetical protein [Pseudomonadota bacterium]
MSAWTGGTGTSFPAPAGESCWDAVLTAGSPIRVLVWVGRGHGAQRGIDKKVSERARWGPGFGADPHPLLGIELPAEGTSASPQESWLVGPSPGARWRRWDLLEYALHRIEMNRSL